MDEKANLLRGKIVDLVRQYFDEAFAAQPFIPGKTTIPYAGRVFDADELIQLVDASLDFWLTAGRFAEQFEHEFARFFGLRHTTRRRSNHCRNWFSHDSQPHYPESFRSGIC
jgi:CDP-6-deoxy-D-xylo-4-hexulose-3-dehydrase